ncbi:GAP family protein [Streptomyces sp. NPDC052682]|uniref:GAP family protein n=1 Tax=Streptomyces sp. NPDC052682 TaxID=3154954 RepID=UPI003421C240
MTTLLAKVLPLALGAAVSPTLFVAAVVLLSDPVRARRRAGAFAVGAAVPLAVIGAAGLVLFRGTRGQGHVRISPVVDLVFGLLLLLLAVRAALVPARTEHRRRHRAVTSPAACAALGAGLMAVNFSSLALFVPAVKEIALSASVSTADQVVVLAIAVVLALLAVLVPLVLYLIAPAQAQSVLTPLLAAAKRHSRAIGMAICLAFGVYLVVKGAVRLS